MQPQFTGNQPQTIPQHPQFTGNQPQTIPQQFTGNQPQTIPQQFTGNQPQTIPQQFTGNQPQTISQHPQQLYEMQPQLTGVHPQSLPQGQGVTRQASLAVGYPQSQVQQGGVPSPQQEFVQAAPQQQGFGQPQQAGMQGFGGTPQYYTATPLAILGQGSAPADCPVCRHRAMTMSNTEVGNTTQYARFLPFVSSLYYLQHVSV
jgi:hypothetical protein